MNNKESFNSSENNPAESTPWDNIGDQFDPPIAPEIPTPPEIPPETPPTPEPNDDANTHEPYTTLQDAELNGGANGENTGDQVNQVE